MTQEIVPIPARNLDRAGLENLPAMIARGGEGAAWRFVEFFTANIRNRNTRAAHAEDIGQFFRWCEKRGLDLQRVNPVTVAAYIDHHPGAAPTVKQHLAAIRMLFDWLVTGQVIPTNPASSVRGPKYLVKRAESLFLQRTRREAFLTPLIPTRSWASGTGLSWA